MTEKKSDNRVNKEERENALRHTSDKIKNINISGIRKIFELAKKVKDPICLNIGLPDFPIDRSMIEEASRAMMEGENQYTSTAGIDELRQKIAQSLSEKQNMLYKKENVIITLAGTGALSIAITMVSNPQDEIIVLDPSFVIYEPLILQNNAIPVVVDVKEDFHLDLLKIEKAVTKKTKAIIINSPNNPTGRVYKEKELRGLANIAQKYDLVIISDEVYKDFIYGGNKHLSVAQFHKNTLVVDSFSKTYAATGWRVGYLAGPQKYIEQALKVEQFNYVCPPTPLQRACVKAFDWDISSHVKEYNDRAQCVYDALKDKYQISKPEGAFYLYIKYPYNAESFINDCLKRSLLVVPGKAFSKKDTHFRISFATSKRDLSKAIDILNDLVSQKSFHE